MDILLESRETVVNACGRVWRLDKADMEQLWETMTDFATDDERLPYWAELWPSSLALSDWLAKRAREIQGRPCLDIGCGIGFTALVGQWLGARVVGMDYEIPALHFALRNARKNGVTPLWSAMDWRKPAVRQGSMAFAWGGDIMYERRFAAPLADFLAHVLAPDGVAWVAEPSRTVYEAFVAAVTSRGMGIRCVSRSDVRPLVPQERPVPVRIWQIAR